MSTPPPRHSLSLPTSASGSNERVLPTPSSSTTTVRQSTNLNHKRLIQRQELEQQIAEKKRQLQETTSGIGKNVLVRQVEQLEEKIKELESQKHEPVSGSPLSSERLKHLERDLADYRKPPGMRSKKESFGQQQRVSMTTGLDLLPSPTASSLLPPHHDSTSLLPLPPPPTGSTPTKRRSKVPNTDRRNTDIEFATEIGQGLLLEVRKMQALLQEKEEQLRTLEIQKADLERAAEAMVKQMRQKEENEEKLKEETWNLELAKQELTISVTELQQNLNKANAEQTKLAKQTSELKTEIEQLRISEEKLNNKIENMKNRYEQDMSSMRRHTAALQRENTDQERQIEALTSELAIAKAQSRIVKHVTPDPEPGARSEQSDDQALSIATTKNETSPTSSPPPSPKQLPARNQAMEVETLKTSLAHAHRMVSNLRSNLHKEKTEKFELKKLLAESQETIEQMQNDPHMWVDAGTGSKDHARRQQKIPKRRVKRADVSTRRGKPNNASSTHLDQVDSSSLSDISNDNDEFEMPDSPSLPLDVSHIGFTSLSSELSQSQRPVAVDAQINTEPVYIEAAPALLSEKSNEASQPDETNKSSLKQITDGLIAGAAAVAAGVVSSAKTGVEISIQTEDKSEGIESYVQTEVIPSLSLSTQTEESELSVAPAVVHTFTQTEPKPEGVESFVQATVEPAPVILTETKPEAIESFAQTIVDPAPAISTQTEDKSEYIEKSVQTASATLTSLPTQTEVGQHLEMSAQTDDGFLQELAQSNESTETIKQKIGVQHTDAEIQTQPVKTKDAQVQYDTDMLKRPLVLPLSQSAQRPFSDDEDNDSFYYDAASDLNQSKPSSRNTLASISGLGDSRQSLKNTEDLGDRSISTLRMSRIDPVIKSASTDALLNSKPATKTQESNDTSKSDKDKKIFSKAETDALIATAVGVALAKAKKSQSELEANRDSAIVSIPIESTPNEHVEEIASSVTKQTYQDKDTGATLAEKENSHPELVDGPSAVFEQEPSEPSEPSEIDSIEDSIPERPTSPPPSSLLSRALSPQRMNKGKMPDPDTDYQRSLNRTPVSMSSMSTANTRDQLRSVTSSHFDGSSVSATDPRMISLVTKTMIGDWLWKNTRKTVGGGMSDNKHQRYFWIHPYTRTLYWSNKSPGLDETHAKAKSALIENITVVPNHATNPEGLPNVSLLVQTPHRQLKLTASNMDQHESWFEAISHLIKRNNGLDIRPPSSRNTKSAASNTGSSLLQRTSLRRLHDMFYQPSISTTTATQRTESTNPDYEDDPLEDVRMCCNGKHHVSKLERDHNHRRQYRKHISRIPHNH